MPILDKRGESKVKAHGRAEAIHDNWQLPNLTSCSVPLSPDFR